MSEFVIPEEVEATPSQAKTIKALHEMVIASYGEGFEYKRFEVHPFSSARILEVMMEVGKIDETPRDAIFNREIRQVFVGERGGCELGNPEDAQKRGKIKGLNECVTESTIS